MDVKRLGLGIGAVCLAAASLSCSGQGDPSDGPVSAPSRPRLSLPAESPAAPSGRLWAEMRQSSIDSSLGRMQVWITNDARRGRIPRSIVYRDDRLLAPLVAERARLRTIPAGSERGFPLVLPRRVDCDVRNPNRAAGKGTVVVRTPRLTRRVRVSDETDVVGRFVSLRCAEQRLAEVASLRWADTVPRRAPESATVGVLTLLVRPTGVPGRSLRIDRIAGSHLLRSADDEPVWKPAVVVRSDGPPTEVRLPLRPSRCDGHAFAEGGGATAFRLRFRLDGEPGELVLRMGEAGRRAAFAFAMEACGLD